MYGDLRLAFRVICGCLTSALLYLKIVSTRAPCGTNISHFTPSLWSALCGHAEMLGQCVFAGVPERLVANAMLTVEDLEPGLSTLLVSEDIALFSCGPHGDAITR